MIAIKKVAVTPVQTNNGTIIDSFNTQDDKHTNAPSINAVENYIETQKSIVQTATVTATKSNIDFTLRFKRNMNVVTVNVEMFIPSTVTSVANWLDSNNFTMPEWAKTTDNAVVNLDSDITSSGFSSSNGGVAFSSVAQIALLRESSNDYELVYLYRQAEGTTYPDGQKLIGHFEYIVLD